MNTEEEIRKSKAINENTIQQGRIINFDCNFMQPDRVLPYMTPTQNAHTK